MDAAPALGAALLIVVLLAVGYAVYHRRDLGSSADRASFDALHTASLAAPGLREGLTAHGAGRAVRHLRALLGTREISCGPDCPVRAVVASPIVDADAVVGAVVAYGRESSAVLVRAVEEVARWVSGQIEIASAEAQRTRLMEAELRALRAQISPHFIYNSLTAIASFTRTDSDRARELLLEFADFTRYALRRGGEFTTLADELRNVERYLVLEQARFGDRLRVSVV